VFPVNGPIPFLSATRAYSKRFSSRKQPYSFSVGIPEVITAKAYTAVYVAIDWMYHATKIGTVAFNVHKVEYLLLLLLL
jgi:hypothetical protein